MWELFLPHSVFPEYFSPQQYTNYHSQLKNSSCSSQYSFDDLRILSGYQKAERLRQTGRDRQTGRQKQTETDRQTDTDRHRHYKLRY